MPKLALILALGALALSACVPVAPYGGYGGYGGPLQVYPETYDLPAHCFYDTYGQVVCA